MGRCRNVVLRTRHIAVWWPPKIFRPVEKSWRPPDKVRDVRRVPRTHITTALFNRSAQSDPRCFSTLSHTHSSSTVPHKVRDVRRVPRTHNSSTVPHKICDVFPLSRTHIALPPFRTKSAMFVAAVPRTHSSTLSRENFGRPLTSSHASTPAAPRRLPMTVRDVIWVSVFFQNPALSVLPVQILMILQLFVLQLQRVFQFEGAAVRGPMGGGGPPWLLPTERGRGFSVFLAI